MGKIDYISYKSQHILTPNNSRITAFNLLAHSITKDMKKDMKTHYFRAEYVGWDRKQEFPECRLVEVFGKFGDI